MQITRIEDGWNYGDYKTRTAPTPTVHALKENKAPVGFAAWSTTETRRAKCGQCGKRRQVRYHGLCKECSWA